MTRMYLQRSMRESGENVDPLISAVKRIAISMRDCKRFAPRKAAGHAQLFERINAQPLRHILDLDQLGPVLHAHILRISCTFFPPRSISCSEI